MCTISIVIPIYNQDMYLRRALTSVIKQSYKDIEVICINDGSTDSSASILDSMQKEDARIRVFKQENSGLVHAVAEGIRKSTGKYICFLDADDYFGEDFLSTAYNEIGSYDFVAFSHFIDTGKTIAANELFEDTSYNKDDLLSLRSRIIWDTEKHKLSKSILNSRWNKLYRTEIVSRFVDLYDSYRYVSFGEDTFFTYLLLSTASNCIVRKRTIAYYYYTGNQNSMMSTGSIDSHLNKAKRSFTTLQDIINSNHEDVNQANAFYFFLIESLFKRLEREKGALFSKLYGALQHDPTYYNALHFLIRYSAGKRKIAFVLRKYLPSARIYLFFNELNSCFQKIRIF